MRRQSRVLELVVALGVLLMAGRASADKPVVIDTIGQLDSEVRVWAYNTRPPSWVIDAQIFVKFPNQASEDILLLQLKEGRKKLGKPIKCKRRDYASHVWESRTKPKKKVPVGIGYYACRPRDKVAIKRGGKYSVVVSYKQTLAGKVIPDIATFRIKVLTLLQGNINKPYKNFFEDNDARLSVATLTERAGSASNSSVYKVLDNAVKRAYYAWHQEHYCPTAVIRVWFKTDGKSLDTRMSCMYKGKKVDETRASGSMQRSYWTYPRKRKPRVRVRWERHKYVLSKLIFDPPVGFEAYKKNRGSINRFWLSKNPGEYRCVITSDGDILREVYFTVGTDGKLVKPACQAKMTALRHVTLLTTKDRKVSTVKYDKKIGKKYGYSGHVVWGKGCPPVKK